MSLIKVQVMTALRRATDIRTETADKIRLGLEKRWIAQILLHGFDEGDKCWAELTLAIDWEVHSVQIEAGHDYVDLPEIWSDGLAPEIDEMIAAFVDFSDERDLRREWRVRYSEGVDREMVDRVLGFRPAPRVEWASGEQFGLRLGLPELDEMTGWLRLVD